MVWPALLVGGDAEGRVLGGEFGERDAELFLVGLRLRLDRDLDHRIGEFHLFQDHRLLGVAQRVAGAHFLEAGQRDDVAGIGFLDVLAVVRMHQQHAADALFAFLGRIDHAGAAGERAGIDAAEGDGADEGVVHDLEGEQRQRRVVLRLADDVFAVVGIDAVDRRHVERARQVIDDGVEQRLHALVLERRAAQHREESAGDHGLADQLLDGGLVGHLAFEVGGGRVIVEFAGRLDHLVAVFLRLRRACRRECRCRDNRRRGIRRSRPRPSCAPGR